MIRFMAALAALASDFTEQWRRKSFMAWSEQPDVSAQFGDVALHRCRLECLSMPQSAMRQKSTELARR